MVGLSYPEIQFDKIKSDYIKGNIVSSIFNFFIQLEKKLIYFEKEINTTKLVSFYTSRTIHSRKKNISYDDSKITKYNDIINWLIIHKSTQLKGIASDKYLSCKYVELKLGKNLCPHRIGVYNSIEEINFEELIKMGNVVLKVSNGNNDNTFITNKYTIKDVEKLKKDITFHFNRCYPLNIPSLFHLYSKKRIILEKMFIPLSDLFEFKILIFNNDIKLIYLIFRNRNNEVALSYYDKNFNPIKVSGKPYFNLSRFNESILNEVKYYAVKLSKDFPNFVRVDLYIFHEKI